MSRFYRIQNSVALQNIVRVSQNAAAYNFNFRLSWAYIVAYFALHGNCSKNRSKFSDNLLAFALQFGNS